MLKTVIHGLKGSVVHPNTCNTPKQVELCILGHQYELHILQGSVPDVKVQTMSDVDVDRGILGGSLPLISALRYSPSIY